jgi:hypothetical protein
MVFELREYPLGSGSALRFTQLIRDTYADG